ncbi:hypothetical protein N7535_005361 [Penicillium sp. DV-2018c]|nr:hypothetical protein N7461_008942 [Penicillium sp. DV-2018c]KAJ5571701.1 hypothetical protein N7535_005361 [Penicillium sp. DV-2018c]
MADDPALRVCLGSLPNELHVSIGCRLMLQSNLWTERGPVNGAFATVRDIIWLSTTVDPLNTSHDALIVTFDAYIGPVWMTDAQGRAFQCDGHDCHRTQFPVNLAYAITVHKSQGVTLDRAVVDISHAEFSTEDVFLDDLQTSSTAATMKAQLDDREKCLPQHWQPPIVRASSAPTPPPLN